MESLLEDEGKKETLQPVTTSLLLLLNTCLWNNTLLEGERGKAVQNWKRVDHPLAQRVLEAALSEKYKR